jgi:hypothetical protein
MDVHVPTAITHGLRRREVDVLTAQKDNAQRLPDDALLERATAAGRVLFTRDEDHSAQGGARLALAFVGSVVNGWDR